MGSKIFLDANVVLDFFLKRTNYHAAKEIIKNVINGNLSAFTTSSIIHITGYWLTKAYGAKKAKKLLIALLNNVMIIDTNHQITLLALNSKIDDIEDALQYYAAIHNRLDYFISEDKKFQKEAISALPIVSCDDFLKFIQNN